MRTVLRLTLLLLLVAPCVVSAKIYKSILADGTIVYSDQPQGKDTQEVELPALQTYSAPPIPPPATSEAQPPKAVANIPYTVVKIVSPASGATLRDSSGTVSVQLAIEPALQAGHVVEIVIDGKGAGSGTATSTSLSNLSRGSHTISAAIKDGDGKVVDKADAVTFQLHKSSKLQPNRAPKPTPKS